MEMLDEQNKEIRKNICVMGCSGVGKTSIRAIIFGSWTPAKTKYFEPTLEIATSDINFFGITVTIKDCGGQNDLIPEYFNQKQKEVFSNLEIFVFVIEAEKRTEEAEKNELDYYKRCIEKVIEYSPNAKVFVLINKMDLIHNTRKEQVLQKRKKEFLSVSEYLNVEFFPTNIWDDSLYIAWQEITSSLLYDKSRIENGLKLFAEICNVNEVILLEPNTFLIFSHYSKNNNRDNTRFYQISKSLKKIYYSFSHNNFNLKAFSIHGKEFMIIFEKLVSNANIMIIVDNLNITQELVSLNIALVREEFEKFFKENKY